MGIVGFVVFGTICFMYISCMFRILGLVFSFLSFEPGFAGFVDFQDWSLVYCIPFHRMTRYYGVVGEWHKLESLCYEERAGDSTPTECKRHNKLRDYERVFL